MQRLYVLLTCLFIGGLAAAAPAPPTPDSAALRQLAWRTYTDSIDGTLRYQQGHLRLPGGVAELTVPRGFRFLDSAQAVRVLTQVWGNPRSECLGMLVPDNQSPAQGESWAYVIRYDPLGYVKDTDAAEIDYADLLKEMQDDTGEENKARESAGFGPVYLLGWAANPYYDKSKNALHWAKSLRFGSSPDTTLNYNVRLLGRKGVLILNAVGVPGQIGEIKASIPGLLAGVTFAKGQQYADFDAGLDEVAAYTIGGLVAGKVLAKVGLFALALKFWKIGLLALAGAWAGLKRFFGWGSKEA